MELIGIGINKMELTPCLVYERHYRINVLNDIS